MTENKKLKIAIVGAGVGVGHARGLAELTDLYDIVVICDLNTERAAGIAREFPGARVEGDMRAVLEDPEIDIVSMCLPPNLHYQANIDGLAAGKHVMGEKPFVTSLADMDRLEEVAASAKGRLFPVFQYRFGPGYRKLMALIESGLLGKAYTATLETHWRREADYYAVPWRGTWAGERGGIIVSHAIHIHDLMSHALGGVKRIAGFLDTRCNPIETEDCGAVSFETGSGALVTSSMTLGAANDMSRMRFCFENATIQSDLEPYTIGMGNWTFEAKTPQLQREIDAVCAEFDGGYSRYAGLYEAVHRTIHGEHVPLLGDLVAARRSIEVVTAIYDAQHNGRVVSLPLGRDHPFYYGWGPEARGTVPAQAATR